MLFAEHVLFLKNEELDAVRDKLQKVGEAANAQRTESEVLLRDRSQRMAAMRELEAERDKILLAKVALMCSSVRDGFSDLCF